MKERYVTETQDWELLVHCLDGKLNPDNIIVKTVSRPSIPFDKEIHQLLGKLDTIKSSTVHEALLSGRKVTAGPQYGLAGYRVPKGTLEIDLKTVTYYDNLQDWGLAQYPGLQRTAIELGGRKFKNVSTFFGRVLAANATIFLLKEKMGRRYRSKIKRGSEIPKDAYRPILLTFRGADQFDYWLNFHNVGGHPKKDDKEEDGFVYDWHNVMKTQIIKELGLRPKDVAKVELIGLAENMHTYKPDLLFKAYINKTPEEMFSLEAGKEREEIMGKVVLDGPDELYRFMAENQEKGEIHHPSDTSRDYRYLIDSVLNSKDNKLDPTTNTNFCPVGEANWALVLQMKGYDLTPIYTKD